MAPLLALLLATVLSAHLVLAFPGMDSGALEDQLARRSFNMVHRPHTKRTDPFLSLPALNIAGIPLPISVNYPGGVTVGRKVIPDSSHPFQNPPSGAQRGGCPGLNLLANYGYIDRSGIVGVGELLWALQEATGWAPDLAGAVVALGFRSTVDVTTMKLSIGNTDSRTSGLFTSLIGGTVPGLFSAAAHTKFETDGSILYDDAYFTPGGTTSQFNATLWAQRLASANSNFGGVFGNDWVGQTRFDSYNYCIQNNPQCNWMAVAQVLFYGAECLTYLNFPSSNSDGTIGSATASVVQTFMGIAAQGSSFVKVPESLPPSSDGHWYRRSTGITLAEGISGLISAYSAHPVVFGSNNGATNSFVAQGTPTQLQGTITVQAVGCMILNEINENVPGSFNNLVTATLTPLIAALTAPGMLNLGC
ncbi:hypothetical protein BCR35DRAFT_292135 [Leucosporidium creatinivorum]|uniref:Heme haloperoxidase family profile domain-containing protein n=1 Tax=Leucosporidium creatinivorum TaxID=106004 RepID=A0A1Y2F3N8_9BASI|nr:hypothetical protein BCR35DRAFT_292135 [Leucosporidium creatinivorum]